MKLFVGNLPYKISESELINLFSEFGEITTLNLIKDQFTGDSKGFAFVEMSSRSSGQQAMEALNKRLYKSRNLVCNEAKPKKKVSVADSAFVTVHRVNQKLLAKPMTANVYVRLLFPATWQSIYVNI